MSRVATSRRTAAELRRARPWLPAEDALLRERYVADGAQACAEVLGRTYRSVTKRAQRIGVVRIQRWSRRDDERLRVSWGSRSIKQIATELGRTTTAVYWRAGHLGLGRGCPKGWIYLSEAAQRTGYATGQLRRILRWADVSIQRALTLPDRRRRTGHVSWYVDPFDVEDAVERWHLTESLFAAARRTGLCASVLARLLDEAAARGDKRVTPRPEGRRHWRVPTALVDELVTAYLARESVRSAAMRVGVAGSTLGRWLKRAGVPHSRKHGVDTAAVDRVVAERRTG